MKKTDNVKFTLRLPKEMCQKLDYISTYWGRTRSGEIHWALRQHIKAFEDQFGEIELNASEEIKERREDTPG